MIAKQISIQKKDANWDELLSLVHEGAEILIMNGDETIARMTSGEAIPQSPIRERVLGAHPGAWMSDDFDAPLDDEFWFGKDV